MTHGATARPDGRRLRGDHTRAAILAAATSLFARQGYAATSLAAIATAAGTKPASIHHAFGSKEGLLLAVMHHVGDAMFERVDTVIDDPGLSPQERVPAILSALIGRPEFLRLFLLLTLERGQGDPAVGRIVEDIRARGRRAVARSVEPLLPELPPGKKSSILDDFSRLTLIMLDGVFLSGQIHGEATHGERTAQLAITALEGALLHLIADPLPPPK